MKKVVSILTFVAALMLGAIMMVSCSKEKQLARRLEGVWKIEKLTLTPAENDGIHVSEENVGTITFNGDGTGKNNYTYSYDVGSSSVSVTDSESFKWDNTENTVTITGNANSGEKSMTWDVDDNTKEEQVWTRTDNQDNMWEIQLHKQ